MRPLEGVQVVEFEGIGPGPLAGMMLADLGATVTVIGRMGGIALREQLRGAGLVDALGRGKQFVRINLKQAEGVELALKLVETADALIEGNRPGVMERLGLGPDVCLKRNPKLVYGRMTGWGQTGPLSQAAGHDINYVALTGLLSLAARPGELPQVPPTVLGDAAGGLNLAFGIVSGVLGARTSGKGVVIDAAMIDAAASLGSLALSLKAAGMLNGKHPSAFHDSPFYDAYECADGKAITIGALEPQFYAVLIEKLGLSDVPLGKQYDTRSWPEKKQRFSALFKTRPRAAWCELLEGTDACFAPVLTLEEAATHPHNVARRMYHYDGRQIQAAAAPRFSGDETDNGESVASVGARDTASFEAILGTLGISTERIAELKTAGIVG